MSKTSMFCLTAAIATIAGSSALAGPAGSGLGLTEEVSRRAAAERTVKIVRDDHPCVQRAAAILKTQTGVTSVKARNDGIQVTFRANQQAAQQEAQIRAVVSDACATA